MTEPTVDQLKTWDRDHYWHGFTQMAEYEPWIIDRAHDCTLVTIDGEELLDGVSSLWCNVHGHRHPKIDAAIRRQLDQVAHATSLGGGNTTTIKLARRLAEISPGDLNHVFFSSDGSSSVEVAIKIALQYWQQCDQPRPNKTRYVALGEAYHGDTLGSVSIGGVDRFHATFRPLLFDVLRLPMPETYRLPDGVTPETVCDHYLAQAEALLRERADEIAALVIEPLVQGAAGMVMHPPGYLRGIRVLTEKYDVLLIADEVAVGMGRTGKMFACEHEQVTPDLLCLAKGLTGGYLPMAVTLASDRVYNAFLGEYAELKTFFHGHTYGGNPLAAAAALATLDVFEEERTLENLQPKITRMHEHLRRIANHPHVGSARQRGMMAGIELVHDRAAKTPYPWQQRRGQQACRHARTKSVWLRPLADVVILMPPLAVTLEELDQILLAAEYGVKEATRE